MILTFLFTWDNGQVLQTIKISETSLEDSAQSYVDTLMTFRNLKPSAVRQMSRLTEDLVKMNLYEYYKDQDCFIEDNYPSQLTDKDYDKNTVRYNLTYFTDLNGDSFVDAIVEYWLMPPSASGHCYQPHKAMVVSGKKKYIFVNPDFIDSFFSIDSVRSVNNKTFIYGCDFDCGGSNKCKRLIRVVVQ
jgi:hypothetical protein